MGVKRRWQICKLICYFKAGQQSCNYGAFLVLEQPPKLKWTFFHTEFDSYDRLKKLQFMQHCYERRLKLRILIHN